MRIRTMLAITTSLLIMGCAQQQFKAAPEPMPAASVPAALHAYSAMAIAPPPAAPGIREPVREVSPDATDEGKYAPHDLDSPTTRMHIPMVSAADQPTSTFSIDVDTGSYSRVRQMLRGGRLPRPSDVRVEEFLNYFDFNYPPPLTPTPPFAVVHELAPAPWAPEHALLLLGIKGFDVRQSALPPANLVFLVDTSGSMASPDKLPLLRAGFATLVDRLRPQDRVAIVTYAGSAGLVLPSTPGDHRAEILAALSQLDAGGSTNGGAGIELAYIVAEQNRIEGGINRVILATDGDFNLGMTGGSLEQFIADQRENDIALTTLGFGAYGYSDATAETLADIGNGNHAFIDDELEAAKVLSRELGSTMLTIAKDVKVQLEFNPAEVIGYRLLGYDNRRLQQTDFANDRVDAGEIGAGHDVTALYQLELADPAGSGTASHTDTVFARGALAQVRVRYKQPQQQQSQELQASIMRSRWQADAPPRLRMAAAIAGFAERLQQHAQLGDFSHEQLAELARSVSLADPYGERAELIDLIELTSALEASPGQR